MLNALVVLLLTRNALVLPAVIPIHEEEQFEVAVPRASEPPPSVITRKRKLDIDTESTISVVTYARWIEDVEPLLVERPLRFKRRRTATSCFVWPVSFNAELELPSALQSAWKQITSMGPSLRRTLRTDATSPMRFIPKAIEPSQPPIEPRSPDHPQREQPSSPEPRVASQAFALEFEDEFLVPPMPHEYGMGAAMPSPIGLPRDSIAADEQQPLEDDLGSFLSDLMVRNPSFIQSSNPSINQSINPANG